MTDDTFTLLDRKPGLYLKHTDTRGRGVFCLTDIKKGETLETTPALILNEEDSAQIESTYLQSYVFKIGDISEELKAACGIDAVDDATCVVMGVGSYCNHSDTPNAQILWEETDGSLLYSLEAIDDIPAGTEIRTTYGETWFSDRDKDVL